MSVFCFLWKEKWWYKIRETSWFFFFAKMLKNKWLSFFYNFFCRRNTYLVEEEEGNYLQEYIPILVCALESYVWISCQSRKFGNFPTVCGMWYWLCSGPENVSVLLITTTKRKQRHFGCCWLFWNCIFPDSQKSLVKREFPKFGSLGSLISLFFN